MNGMTAFVAERIRIETSLDQLMSMSTEGRIAAIAKIKQEAEERSGFKKHQLVRVCRSPGFSLATGPYPHDHSDPDQHFDSRVMGWDTFGRLDVALKIYSNPHRSSSCWSDDMVHPRDGKDWADSSSFKVDQEISFEWEHLDWSERQGRIIPAVLVGPHIEPNDWLVRYEKPCGMWITRVLNEQYMRLR